MGGTFYNSVSRSSRSEERGYTTVTTATMHTVFEQKAKGEAHDSMKSQGIALREARDSEAHPNTFPVIIALDVTGSMHDIPVMLIKDGLPKLVSQIIQRGVPDVALLFMAIGDHECDDAPLQIGQFESGDEELDLWLTRTYPEGGGGVNRGESYGLAHNFAANHIITDAWEKRGKKGVLIVIGDEPGLKTYPTSAMREVTGNPQAEGFTDIDALKAAQEKWEVFHINPHHKHDEHYWKPLLGQNYISLSDHHAIPEIVTKIVCDIATSDESSSTTAQQVPPSTSDDNPGFIR